MIINHNLMANNAIRSMNTNTGNASKSMAKLSSGLRINTAGDDAAGLAISEKMRGQIRGLDQASSNAQDGISLLQTAEGNLSESTSILQRMRELAVQGSNDTLNSNDRGQIQKEMDQLTSEIDRIGNTTEFNTKKLLNGGANVSGTVGTSLTAAVSIIGGSGDTQVGSTVTVSAASNAVVAATAGAATSSDTLLSGTTISANASLTINGTSFSFTSGQTKQSVLDAINNAGLGLTATANATGNLVLTDNTVGSANKFDLVLGTGFTNGGSFAAGAHAGTDASITLKGGETYTADGNEITIQSGNAKGLQLEVSGSVGALVGGTANGVITATTNGTLTLQIGANEGQTMNIGISDMRSAALGVSGIKVTDAKTASAAITTIQTAIDKVSSERAKLGAVTNRLEHTISNLGTSSENMTSAESRIRDVDMAKEMSNYSKNNILSQAAQAMLAQANQQPQQVLQLLR